MSYPDGCRPTRQQIERDLKILLKKYGMEKHPLIWYAHGSTSNFHVHFLLIRISQTPDEHGSYPIADNGQVKKTSKEQRKNGERIRVKTDWTAYRQCAVAELNDVYGGAHKVTSVTHPTVNQFSGKTPRTNIPTKPEKMNANLEKSKKRLLPVFKDAQDWPFLIQDIQMQCMCLERSGGGLVVEFNDKRNAIKCSEISKRYSLSKLEKVFGSCPLPKAALPAPTYIEQQRHTFEAAQKQQCKVEKLSFFAAVAQFIKLKHSDNIMYTPTVQVLIKDGTTAEVHHQANLCSQCNNAACTRCTALP